MIDFDFSGRPYLLGERIGASPLLARKDRASLARPPGRVIRQSSMALKRRLNSSRSQKSLEVDVGKIGPICNTPERLRYWVGILDQLKDVVRELPSELAAAEETTRGKAGAHRGALMGWDLIPEGLVQSGGHGMRDAFHVIGSQPEWASFKPALARMPVDTNPGAPTYEKGLVDALLHRLITIGSGGSWAVAKALYAEAAIALNADTEIHAIMFTRTGSCSKELPAYTLSTGSVTREGYLTGYVTAHRAVFGVPRWINEHFVANVTGVKDVLMKNGVFNHSLPRDQKSKGIRIRDWFAIRLRTAVENARKFDPGAYVLQDDISAFDRNVRPAHHESLEALYRQHWGPSEASAWREAQSMGILAPAWGSAKDDAYMYERPKGGTTTSGIISTSADGCLLNFARVLTAMAAGMSVSVRRCEEMRLQGRWSAFIWGDDTLLVVPRGFDAKAYTEASLEAGFPCKLDSPPVFLMTFIDWRLGKAYNLGTRILDNRVFPERPPRIDVLRLLGLVDGMDAMDGNPLRDTIWGLLREDSLVRDRNIRSLASLFEYAESGALEAEIKDVINPTTGPDEDTANWLSSVTEHGFGAAERAGRILGAFGRHIGIRTAGWTSSPYEASQGRALLKELTKDLRHDREAAKEKWLKYARILVVQRGRDEEDDDDTAE